ncbi:MULTISPECIES: helix-turn-helix domain-containing protein [Clostridium]|uniref:Helix-turn-helix domain protein n=3 Tax=Clostridium TaxID=1485 RepID=A0A166UNA7_9CLOT|nr:MULTISPECIES: helix-turn-helix domain-containing protein [Clostridium]AGY74341.1 helix-turn-helix domain-containing protein [Clostridium autoethanogenum DSM 10061]ALU34532.1 DNA-binding domain excisionase family protein [Clostridium autoethanogenum DSM 10061]OAA95083.1 Helix-turn-helix domain protein [Clostridium coskatii]OBR97569.1 helix-turn-helix domain protein [Clostridium coskatii]OVY51252.1 Helix-turn-helix domain protein [Clostridium autoethanogenum]
MDNNILNLEQAIDFLGVSEKTLIKLLREEHVPARKIGREWRFNKQALINWIASGDSMDYINQNERYIVSEDISGESTALFDKIDETLKTVKEHGYKIKSILKQLDKDIEVPDNSTLRISYKQQREVEKLEFKVFWDLRENSRFESNKK